MIFLIIGLCMNFNVWAGLAAPPQEEIDSLLAQLGWSQADLQSYLDYYEMSIDEFSTIEELDDFLGTPITDENIEQLLNNYDMTRAELDTLLAGFGETVDDYWFIEDLDVSIDFYQNHDEEMKESEDFLAMIGLTEEEVDQFFNHLMALDQTALENQMMTVSTRLEPFLEMDPETELSDEQVQELTAVWTEILTLLKLDPKYYLVDAKGGKRPVTFSELAIMETLNDDESLLLELYDTAGTLLLDLQLSEDMLTSDFVFDGAEELTKVGELAGELTKLKHEKLPNTATSYGLNMVIGLLMIMIGSIIFLKVKKRTLEK
jgi:processed acidic surface protein